MQFEIDDVEEQSGDSLSADWGLLGGAAAYSEDDMALLALVRDSVIEERSDELARDGLKVAAFTPNAVALHNACVATDGGEGTVMVAFLGGRNTDIALVKDGELLFARNLNGGGDLFTDAIATTFRVDAAKAEAVKKKQGLLARPGEKLAGQQAAVARALEGGLRQVTGMLQSSLLLCRTQLKARDIALDRVLLCGPGASLPGLDEALTRTLDVPVERFDPCAGYVTGDVDVLHERGPDFAVAAGLAMMGALPGAERFEILTDEARRGRTLREKTLWLVLAGVLVLAHLGLYAWGAREGYDAAKGDLVRMRREVESRKADTRGYERSAAEVAELSARLERIEQATAPGAGLVTALSLLEELLPEELWITSVRTVREIDADFGHGTERRPLVVVEGRGKELSRNLADAVTELTRSLRERPAVAAVVPKFTTDNRGDFVFELRLDMSLFPTDPDADDGGDGAGDDDEGGEA